MTDTEVTITIPVAEAAQRHIEHLQATLTKRNERIEQLEERLAQAESGEPNQAALARARTDGWKAAANSLMGTTREMAQTLGRLRKDAFDVYLQAERDERATTRPDIPSEFKHTDTGAFS